MDNSLEDKISEILSSPEDLKKIIGLVGSLSSAKSDGIETEAVEKSSESATHKDSEIEKLFRHGKNERLMLLSALKPYLTDDKKNKIDTILKMLNAAELLFSAKNII